MAFRYREKFLTEKCINTLANDYIDNRETYHSAAQDFKIAFCEFLSQNESQYVSYGIDYLCKNYPNEAKDVMELIMEYRTHGTKEGLSWDPIPDKSVTNPIYSENLGVDCSEEVPEETIKKYDIDEKNCTVKEKIVLFVMKLLRF